MAGKRAVLIAGPTASGKSALALEIAERDKGTIVNADAMQIYRGMRIVTAQPDETVQARAPHLLFGAIDPSVRFSVGAWADAVKAIVADHNGSTPLIFVGGTGLYFESLVNGLSAVPHVPDEIVNEVEMQIRPLDRNERSDVLMKTDPELTVRIGEADFQRTVRALSVFRHTGKRLSAWQDEKLPGLLDGFEVRRHLIDPPREILNERIATRFRLMLDTGAIDEVKALLERDLDKSLPAMRAIGVLQIAALLKGNMDRETAIEKAVIATRQYAKRQRTWARGHMAEWERIG